MHFSSVLIPTYLQHLNASQFLGFNNSSGAQSVGLFVSFIQYVRTMQLRSGLHSLSILPFDACSMLEIVLATPSARYEVIEAALLKIKVSGFMFVIWLILLPSSRINHFTQKVRGKYFFTSHNILAF